MKVKEFFKNLLYFCIAIACLAVAVYFGILTYKQLTPQSVEQQKMHCLELGSNARAAACMKLIK